MSSDEVIQCDGYKFKKLYTQKQIQQRIDILAKQIDKQFTKIKKQDPSAKFLILGILNGSFMFVSDLVKKLKNQVFIDFIRASSYVGTQSGQLTIQSNINKNLYKDAYILIVDDICDTGKTLKQLSIKMKEFQAKKVWISVLVFRPDREHDIEPDFIGLPCTEFIIGYGLDFNLKGRQYCNIYQKIDE